MTADCHPRAGPGPFQAKRGAILAASTDGRETDACRLRKRKRRAADRLRGEVE